MESPLLHSAEYERAAALSVGLKRCRVVYVPYVADYSALAKKAWVLRSKRGDHIARYGSSEAAEKAAWEYEAACIIAEGSR